MGSKIKIHGKLHKQIFFQYFSLLRSRSHVIYQNERLLKEDFNGANHPDLGQALTGHKDLSKNDDS